MADKFEIYDLIGVVVPGTLLICVLALFFPDGGRKRSPQFRNCKDSAENRDIRSNDAVPQSPVQVYSAHNKAA